MSNNESGVTEIFVTELRERAFSRGIDFLQFPLGPQDRHLLSDSLFANNFDHFSLVEMKFSDLELKSEAHKRNRVTALCRALAKNPRMRRLHDQCHMIAWTETVTGELKTSPYRHQICNQEILGVSCDLRSKVPNNSWTVDITEFGNEFFGNPAKRCLRKDSFKEYVKWLLDVVTESKVDNLEVIAKGWNLENKPIVTIMSFDQLCDDLALKAKENHAATNRGQDQAKVSKKFVENLLRNGD